MSPEDLTQAVAQARQELARVDTKASMLLALAGGGLAVIAAAGTTRPPWPVATLTAVAAACVAVALWLLLTVVRPRLTGDHGIVAWSTGCPVDQAEQTAAELRWLSGEALRRHRLIQRAVDLLRAALAAGVLAAAVALIGGAA